MPVSGRGDVQSSFLFSLLGSYYLSVITRWYQLAAPQPRVQKEAAHRKGPICHARLTSWRATAARTVRVCAHLPRAFMHPGLGACVPCGASCSGGPALAYAISGGGASCHRPVPAASRFWARRDARSKGGVLSSAGGRTKQQPRGMRHRFCAHPPELYAWRLAPANQPTSKRPLNLHP